MRWCHKVKPPKEFEFPFSWLFSSRKGSRVCIYAFVCLIKKTISTRQQNVGQGQKNAEPFIIHRHQYPPTRLDVTAVRVMLPRRPRVRLNETWCFARLAFAAAQMAFQTLALNEWIPLRSFGERAKVLGLRRVELRWVFFFPFAWRLNSNVMSLSYECSWNDDRWLCHAKYGPSMNHLNENVWMYFSNLFLFSLFIPSFISVVKF